MPPVEQRALFSYPGSRTRSGQPRASRCLRYATGHFETPGWTEINGGFSGLPIQQTRIFHQQRNTHGAPCSHVAKPKTIRRVQTTFTASGRTAKLFPQRSPSAPPSISTSVRVDWQLGPGLLAIVSFPAQLPSTSPTSRATHATPTATPAVEHAVSRPPAPSHICRHPPARLARPAASASVQPRQLPVRLGRQLLRLALFPAPPTTRPRQPTNPQRPGTIRTPPRVCSIPPTIPAAFARVFNRRRSKFLRRFRQQQLRQQQRCRLAAARCEVPFQGY